MNRINSLYNYLIKNSYFIEANYLYKLAARIDGEKYKQEYPVMYEAWRDRNDNNIPDKPWHAYANMLKNLEEKDILIDKNKVYIFDDLKDLLTKEKKQVKTQQQDELIKFLNQNLPVDKIPSEEDLNLAKQKGLNKEEILYLIIDQTNHTWFEKVDVANKFNNAKTTAFPEQDENKTIMDFTNIDEALDFMQSKLNKAPESLEQFYANIKQKALATSVTVYNSNNYIVVHSKSMEAAQYWEQSCVTVDKDGKVSAGTCTSRITDNYFDYYDTGKDSLGDEYRNPIHSFQIITKEYKTKKETPRTSFKDKNKFFNFISLSIDKVSGEVKWGPPDTVNRLNQGVYGCDLLFTLKDEYNKIISALTQYCEKKLKLTVDESGFYDERICDMEIRDEWYNPSKFFNFNLEEKYPQHTDKYLELLDVNEYFKLNFNEKYPKHIEKKLKDIKATDFFKMKLDDTYKEIIPIKLEEIRAEILPQNFQNLTYLQKADLLELAKLYLDLNLDEKYKESKTTDAVVTFMSKHDPLLYFKNKLYEKYSSNKEHRIAAYNAIEKLSPETFFEGNEESIAEAYKNVYIEITESPENSEDYQEKLNYKLLFSMLWEEKLEELRTLVLEKDKDYIFRFHYDRSFGYYIPDIIKQKLEEFEEEEEISRFDFKKTGKYENKYFTLKLDEKYGEIYPEILIKNLSELSTENYFLYELDEKYGEDDEKHGEDFKNIFKDKIKSMNLYECVKMNLDFKHNDLIYEFRKDEIKELSPEAYFELELNFSFGDKDEELLKENLKKLSVKFMSQKFLAGKGRRKSPDFIRKFLEDNSLIYNLFDVYANKFPEIVKSKIKELDEYEYFTTLFGTQTSIAERFGLQYPEILKDNLNKIPTILYFDYKVDDLFGKEFPDIFLEKVKEMHPYYFFENNLHNKYAEGELKIPLNILMEKANEIMPQSLFELGLDKDERFKSITNSIKINNNITTFEED